MKILQISNRVPWPLNEGGTIGIYNFTKAFAEAGHEVYLYCLDGLKHNTPIAEAKKELEKYAKLLIHPVDTDVKIEDAIKNIFSSESYNVERFNNGAFRQELISLLTSTQFDVVQLEGTYLGPYVEAVRNNHKGLLSLRMHNVEHQIWYRLAENTKNPVKKRYLQLLAKRLKKYEKDLLSKVDLIVPVTQDDEKVFNSLSSTPTVVIPAGIDVTYWKFNPPTDYSKWYHIGSLEWLPNKEAIQWYLREWHPILANSIQNYSFHLAGKGINTNDYLSDQNTHLYDFVEDAYRFVSDKSICVVPLLSGSGIRLKILEAMASGKLVISTTVGAQGITVKHGVNILIANDPMELKALLGEMNKGTFNLDEIVRSARKLIEDSYSITAVCDKLLVKYAEVTS